MKIFSQQIQTTTHTMHVYTHMHACTQTYTLTYMHTQMYMQYVCTCTHTYSVTCTQPNCVPKVNHLWVPGPMFFSLPQNEGLCDSPNWDGSIDSATSLLSQKKKQEASPRTQTAATLEMDAVFKLCMPPERQLARAVNLSHHAVIVILVIVEHCWHRCDLGVI